MARRAQEAKKSNKKVLLILGLILIVAAAIVLYNYFSEDSEGTGTTDAVPSSTEKYVEILTGGLKRNTSEKLKEQKTIDGITIDVDTLTQTGGISRILAALKNGTDETVGGYPVTITMLDENGKVLFTLEGYIDEMEPGGTAILDASATADFANAYDFVVEKKVSE